MFLDENIYEIIDQLSVTLLTYIDGQRIVVQHKQVKFELDPPMLNSSLSGNLNWTYRTRH